MQYQIVVIVGLAIVAHCAIGTAIFVAILPALVRDVLYATGSPSTQRVWLTQACWSITFLWPFYTLHALKKYIAGSRWNGSDVGYSSTPKG